MPHDCLDNDLATVHHFDIPMMRCGLRTVLITLLALGAPMALTVPLGRIAEAQVVHQRPWLGVEFESSRALTAGARVVHVVRNSPASAAGLWENDIITAVDERAVLRADDAIRAIGVHGPGDKVQLSISRGAGQVRVSALLGRMPDPEQMLRLDRVGAPAPGWKGLAAVSGEVPASLSEMRGKVVVVDFWAPWCTACRAAGPRLSALQAKYGAQGLSIIGITDDPVPDASQAAATFGMRYPIATDETGAIQRAFGVRALPTVFVIDKRGVVREVAVGYDPGREPELQTLLQRLLAEPGP